jgi:hypothetical protein
VQTETVASLLPYAKIDAKPKRWQRVAFNARDEYTRAQNIVAGLGIAASAVLAFRGQGGIERALGA